ncbi:MAG: InlB B-repeat-containing protein [Treponema sp.]|jgi:uncharacterized repeat protein (TIGR02543 family)|nr:InlB B-repeat-containing protein [Treponema sp.]
MTTGWKTAYLALCAGLLLFAGCKDLFHPDGPKQDDYTGGSRTTQYTVSYNANGASGTPPAAQTVDAGGSVTLAGQQGLRYTGYTFASWNTNAGGTGTSYSAGASYTPAASITLYAQWTPGTPVQYTVSFNADGGSPETQTRTVPKAASVGTSDMPSDPAKTHYTFGGWYTGQNGGGTLFTATTTVTADITVYAKWKMPDNLSLDGALTWINANAVEGGEYIITVKNNETIAPKTLSYNGKNVSITIMGDAAERTVSLSSTGSLFAVGYKVTLILDNNITLQGRSDNTASLVRVNSGGTLVMNTGSKISGNTSSPSGGGVYVFGSGTFTMSGGTISGNTSSSYGGGVYYQGSGTFTMSGGTISGNTSSSYHGGGVYYVGNGTFTMSGGTISGNTSFGIGGGVFVYDGTFTMSGGTISGNTASYGGGGGVYAGGSGTFTMSGGTISGNTSSSGGGVYVYSGTFIKQQSGGVIYGSNAGSTLKNTAGSGDNYGHAVFVRPTKKRNTTAGVGVTLNSSVSGSAGGWE